MSPARRRARRALLLAHRRAARRARGRRDRAADRLPRQRPAGRDAGRGGAGLPQPLGRGAARAPRSSPPTTTAGAPPRDLAAAGVEVAALIDARPDAAPPDGALARSSPAAWWSAPAGGSGLRAIRVRHGDREHAAIAADCLAVSGGWNPPLHLDLPPRRAAGLGSARRGLRAGRGSGAGTAASPGRRRATSRPHAASRGGAAWRRRRSPTSGSPRPRASCPRRRTRRCGSRRSGRSGAPGRAWLDFQNDVTVKDVALAARENFRAAEHMKRYTTLGMATDQGKTGSVAGLAVLAELTGRERRRDRHHHLPPALHAGADRGARARAAPARGFAPQRFTAGARRGVAARRAGASRPGSGTGRAGSPRPARRPGGRACDREVGMVRTAVGVCDVTTLGKIDVQGPDAAAFLDRVYANTISTLAVGRVPLRADAARGRLRHGRRHGGAARPRRISSSPPPRRRPAR